MVDGFIFDYMVFKQGIVLMMRRGVTSFTQDPANVDMRRFPSITRFLRSRVNEAGTPVY